MSSKNDNLIKCEMHLHSKGGSGCAQMEPDEIAQAYFKMGYGAITITNHYIKFLCEEICDGNPRKYAEHIISLYEKLKKSCKKYNIKVFLGLELTPYRPFEKNVDILIYGLTPKLLFANPELYLLSDEKLFEFANQNNLIICQAHPFRDYCRRFDINYIHGIEAYNGYPLHPANNELSVSYAQEHKKLMVSGSDFHEVDLSLPQDYVRGGILIPDYINNAVELARFLKNNQPILIKDCTPLSN